MFLAKQNTNKDGSSHPSHLLGSPKKILTESEPHKLVTTPPEERA